jgi:Protein of unknown function (DUF3592)
MMMIHAAFARAAERWQSYVLPRVIQIEAWLQCRLDRLASARDARLMEGGIEINATITKVRRSVSGVSRQARWRVLYRYEYTVGWPLTGISRPLSGDTVSKLRPGDQVLIKVDPGRPERSLFVGRG